MSGEACGAWCGHCGRCDTRYAVQCASIGCRNAVTFPDFEVFCSPCIEKHRLRAIRIEQQERARLIVNRGAA